MILRNFYRCDRRGGGRLRLVAQGGIGGWPDRRVPVDKPPGHPHSVRMAVGGLIATRFH
jgi:hypothetical protein